MAEIDGSNAMGNIVGPSPPIALGDWLTGAKYKKQKGSSPPTAIWAIGLEGEKDPSTNHH